MASKIPIVLWLLLLDFSYIILIGNNKASATAAWEANISICFDFVIIYYLGGSTKLACLFHHWTWTVVNTRVNLPLNLLLGHQSLKYIYFVFFLHFGYTILFAWLYPKVDIVSCRPILFIWATFQRVILYAIPAYKHAATSSWQVSDIPNLCFNYPQFITLDKLLDLVLYWILN